MKIAVVGAGVVGLASAHELMLAGHDVTVLERHSTAAEEGSFAPGGLVHAAWALGWAMPQPRLHLPWSPSGPGLRWRSAQQWSTWSWARRWRASQRSAPADARLALLDLLNIGQERQHTLTSDLELDHDRSDGLLVLAREERQFGRASVLAHSLRELGLPVRPLSAEEARHLEPALATGAPLAGAVHLGGPAVGNCREWALLMRQALLQGGGRFLSQQLARSLTAAAGGVDVASADGASERFDAVVVCAGVQAVPLLQSLGLRTPFRVWWSHSLSAPLREPVDSPQSGVLDLHSGVAVTRLGQRIRASGGWDLGGEPGQADKTAVAHLAQVMSHWFPAAARLGGSQSALQPWRGACLVAADGLPVIGASRVPGVWLNIAHGPRGWAMACGAAHRLAEAMTLDEPSTIVHALSPARLGM